MQTVSAQDVKHMWDRGEDFLLINTLPPEQFAETKIPGAVNISESDDDFVDRVLARAGTQEKAIVVYGAGSEFDSSSTAARKLLEAGFEDVAIFEEGAAGWREFMKSKRGAGSSRW